MIFKLRKALVRYFSQMRWHTVVLALFIYGISSWWLLYAAGETALLVQPTSEKTADAPKAVYTNSGH